MSTQSPSKRLLGIIRWHEAFSHYANKSLLKDRLKSVGINPSDFTVINVAGTNGKGSTVTLISSMLTECNIGSVAYINPIVTTANKMLFVNGGHPSDDMLLDAIDHIYGHYKGQVLDLHTLMILCSFLIADKSGCKFVILEAGGGGKDDVINGIDPDISILTNATRDHMPAIGKTIDDIGLVKAHIFRTGKPAIVGGDSIPSTVFEYAKKIDARLLVNNIDYTVDIKWDRFPEENAQMAYKAVELAGVDIDIETAYKALDKFSGVGYFDTYHVDGKTIIADKAHNTDGVAKFVDKFIEKYGHPKNVVVFAKFNTRKTHCFHSMICDLNRIATEWVDVNHPKSVLMKYSQMQSLLNVYNMPLGSVRTVSDAVEYVKRLDDDSFAIFIGCLPLPYDIKALIS